MRQAGEDVGLEAFDVDLGEGGAPCAAISASSVVTGTSMVRSQTWPSQPPAPSAALTKSVEAVVTVGLAELMCSVERAGLGAAGGFDQRDVARRRRRARG